MQLLKNINMNKTTKFELNSLKNKSIIPKKRKLMYFIFFVDVTFDLTWPNSLCASSACYDSIILAPSLNSQKSRLKKLF